MAVASTLLVAAVVVPASPAFASAASGDYNSAGVRIRSCPHTTCTIYGLGYHGQGVNITCYKIGDNINGDSYWLYHKNKTTGVTGYSADIYINVISGTIPKC